MSKFWHFLTYTWRVAINLVEIVIVLYIFSRLHSRFEFIVVSILGLIYCSLRTMGGALGLAIAQMSTSLDRELTRIRMLLGQDEEYHLEEFAEAETNSNRQAVKIWINLSFVSIIGIICLFNLLVHS